MQIGLLAGFCGCDGRLLARSLAALLLLNLFFAGYGAASTEPGARPCSAAAGLQDGGKTAPAQDHSYASCCLACLTGSGGFLPPETPALAFRRAADALDWALSEAEIDPSPAVPGAGPRGPPGA